MRCSALPIFADSPSHSRLFSLAFRGEPGDHHHFPCLCAPAFPHVTQHHDFNIRDESAVTLPRPLVLRIAPLRAAASPPVHAPPRPDLHLEQLWHGLGHGDELDTRRATGWRGHACTLQRYRHLWHGPGQPADVGNQSRLLCLAESQPHRAVHRLDVRQLWCSQPTRLPRRPAPSRIPSTVHRSRNSRRQRDDHADRARIHRQPHWHIDREHTNIRDPSQWRNSPAGQQHDQQHESNLALRCEYRRRALLEWRDNRLHRQRRRKYRDDRDSESSSRLTAG